MKKRIIGIVLLIIGIVPFILPFAGGLYTISVQSDLTMGDWLIMYSFLYWPSYIAGLVLIAAALIIIRFSKRK